MVRWRLRDTLQHWVFTRHLTVTIYSGPVALAEVCTLLSIERFSLDSLGGSNE